MIVQKTSIWFQWLLKEAAEVGRYGWVIQYNNGKISLQCWSGSGSYMYSIVFFGHHTRQAEGKHAIEYEKRKTISW